MYGNSSTITEVEAAELTHRLRRMEEAVARMEHTLADTVREAERSEALLVDRVSQLERAVLPPWQQAKIVRR